MMPTGSAPASEDEVGQGRAELPVLASADRVHGGPELVGGLQENFASSCNYIQNPETIDWLRRIPNGPSASAPTMLARCLSAVSLGHGDSSRSPVESSDRRQWPGSGPCCTANLMGQSPSPTPGSPMTRQGRISKLISASQSSSGREGSEQGQEPSQASAAQDQAGDDRRSDPRR